ncbi:MAG: hypothetical protein ACJAS4_000847 [Bacteriovoracaceae bacterium]|jgi:phosphoribosylanthranilate isomerase
MSEINLNQIFIAHPVAFVVSTITEFAKESGVSVFVLDDLNDFRYLIEDLNPQALIIHEDLWNGSTESFNRETTGFECLRTILIQKNDDNNGHLSIVEPFEPSKFIEQVKQLLESDSKKH